MPVPFSSTCCNDERAPSETPSWVLFFQGDIEAGDRLRALIAETNRTFENLRDWETPVHQSVPQLLPRDCRSVVEHLNGDSNEDPGQVVGDRNHVYPSLFVDRGRCSQDMAWVIEWGRLADLDQYWGYGVGCVDQVLYGNSRSDAEKDAVSSDAAKHHLKNRLSVNSP